MKFNKNVLIAGFAMFSMFFGSGNLVFPILVGVKTMDAYFVAILGLMITAVLMPFMGLVGVSLFNGDRKEYFSSLGEKPALVLALIILSLQGPLGSSSRCVTVAYNGMSQLMPNLSSVFFGVIFCVLVGIMIWKRGRIVDLIGSILTPLLLISIVIVILVGLFFDSLFPVSDLASIESFRVGFFQGYQTTDLLAAFFFAAASTQYLKSSAPENSDTKTILKLSLSASVIGATVLALVYVGFVILGAKFAPILQAYEPGEYLIIISHHVLGDFAVPVISSLYVLACLTTVTILISLFSDLIYKELLKEKVSRHMIVILSLVATFGFSRLGFTVICGWLGVIVQVIYPALIGFAIANILKKLYGFKKSNSVFYILLILSSFWRLVY